MFNRIRQHLAALAHDEHGASLVEYILLLALIAMAAFVGLNVLGRTSANRMNNVATTVDTAG
jgi:Flp pilus assembly pilin Flp